MNNSTPRVLVLGAAGRFGQAAVSAFAAAGWQVLAQARRTPAWPAGVTAVATPLDDVAALAAQAHGASVVVHAINPGYSNAGWRAQVLPLARLGLGVAERLGASFMLPGNVYNFGEGMPALLIEATPERPSTVKGAIRCDLEAELEDHARRGQRVVVLRAGDFFGAGTGSWFDQAIVKSIAKGCIVYPGPLDVPHAWAYLPDLARAFVAAAAARDHLPAFTRLHFAGHTLTGGELLAGLERAAADLGIAPAGTLRRGGIPWPLIRAGGLLVPAWRAIAEMAYLWRVPHALDGSALRRTLGPLPGTDLDSALRQSLQSLGLAATAAPVRPVVA